MTLSEEFEKETGLEYYEYLEEIGNLVPIEYVEWLIIQRVSQQRELLEAYTQFLWTQHNNLTNADNNKIALDKFIASNCG
jgi:hypothetical protein